MKASFFFFVALAIIASASAIKKEEKEKLKGYADECQKETEIDVEISAKLRKGDFSNDSDKSKEFIYCVMTKCGIIDKEGVLQKDVVLSKANEDEKKDVEKAFDICVKETGETKLDKAFNYMKCFRKEHDKDLTI